MIKKMYKIPVELHYYCDDCNVEVQNVITSDGKNYKIEIKERRE